MTAAVPSVYLDTCCYQRPIDPAVNERVRAEARAMLDVFAAFVAGRAVRVDSPVVWYETGLNPDEHLRGDVRSFLAGAGREAAFDRGAAELAATFARDRAIRDADGMHLACAVTAGADFFCTVDDKLFRRARAADTGGTALIAPADLAAALSA